MNFPPDIEKSVAVYHLAPTGSQVYGSATTIQGGLLPLDRKENALEGGDYTDAYELYVEGTADVRVGDKLVIDSVNYYAKKVFSANFGGLAHKRISISTQA